MSQLSDGYDPEDHDLNSARIALDALYRAHAAWLSDALERRFGRRLCAEDLVQETYVRAAGRSPPLSLAQPRAWLWRVAERLALDQLRRLRRSDAAASDARQAHESHAPAQEDSVLLAELIADLPDTVRDTFCLSRFGGLGYEEISRRQGVSVKTVEWRISRALQLLAARLSE